MVIVALLLVTHLDESPVTGRTRLLVFSRENYMELAALTSEAVREGGGGLVRVCVCGWVGVFVCVHKPWRENNKLSLLHTVLTAFFEMKL